MLRKFILTTLMMALIMGLPLKSKAEISKAAVLFLRIAAGARPAGMGDAFVAIADDATATHWNPAGLGAYPLSNSWRETRIPSNLFSRSNFGNKSSVVKNSETPLVIKAFAPVKVGSGSDYQSYDYWILTSQGIARYDNKNWYPDEKFDTKTNQTLRGIVTGYMKIEDDEEADKIIHMIATANSSRTSEEVATLQAEILKIVPADYSMLEGMKTHFDNLIQSYDLCLINWERFKKVEDIFKDASKDGSYSESELDKINFAVEKSKNRFLPEELIIPYSYLFQGEIVDIASSVKQLAVATTNGLVVFNGRQWRSIADESLPSKNITSLFSLNDIIYVGTDKGIVQYNGLKVVPFADNSVIPEGPVSAMGGKTKNSLWAVINDDLYFFNGKRWSNSHPYKMVIDDSAEKIAKKFSLYGTEKEAAMFIDKLMAANMTSVVDRLIEVELEEHKESPVEGLTPGLLSEATEETSETNVTTETETVDETTTETKVAELVLPDDTVNEQFDIGKQEPGTVIKVPYVGQIKGKVYNIHVDLYNNLWLGTEYGIFKFDDTHWQSPGYTEYVVKDGETVEDIVNKKKVSTGMSKARYTQVLKDINDLTTDELASGTKIKIYKNPSAIATNMIASIGSTVLFATNSGLLQYDGKKWRRFDLKGMGDSKVLAIRTLGDELWIVSDEKFIARANGKSELTAMHVNWLPELADDLYYEYLGVVTHLNGIGTVGINATFITYGSIVRTDDQQTVLGTFEPFDVALTFSYGSPLTGNLKGGISAKLIYSRLSSQGAGQELGEGTATAFAFDLGLLYSVTSKLNLGMAVTNIGPRMSYIDAAQSDPLPTNLALGFAYKVLRSDYYQLLVTAEGNKQLVGKINGIKDFGNPSEGLVLNGGAEFEYANLLALRAGYIYDEEGELKAFTLGFGLKPLEFLKADFAYIPSNENVVLANTLRFSLTFSL